MSGMLTHMQSLAQSAKKQALAQQSKFWYINRKNQNKEKQAGADLGQAQQGLGLKFEIEVEV